MRRLVKNGRRAFSLVELLAVVLILAVLAGVAVPVYLNSRKAAAARTCAGNIAAIAKAESVTVLHNGDFTTTATDLVTQADGGLASVPTCPLDGSAYTLTAPAAGQLKIECPNKAAHATATGGAATTWSTTLKAPSTSTDATYQ